MSLLFNMLSRLVIAFLPGSKCLLISWLQSPSAVILEPPKITSLVDFPGVSDGKACAYSARDPGQSLGQEDLPGKEMATHSSILAWKIPWTEEPGRAIVHGVAKNRTWLSDFTFLSFSINKVCHCFHCFLIYLLWSDGTRCLILVFWMLSFKPTFSLSSFTFITRLFSCSSLSAVRVVSSAYLRLLIFLLAILIPVCASSSPANGHSH